MGLRKLLTALLLSSIAIAANKHPAYDKIMGSAKSGDCNNCVMMGRLTTGSNNTAFGYQASYLSRTVASFGDSITWGGQEAPRDWPKPHEDSSKIAEDIGGSSGVF